MVAFLTPAFFPAHAALVSWGLVALSLLVLAVAGIIVNKLAFHGEQTAAELVARHAVVADKAVVWPAGITPTQKAVAIAQLQERGVLVRLSA
mgnify:CR=1 FL=1